MMGYYGYGMMGGGWSFIGSLVCLLVIVFLVLGIAFFWKELNKPGNRR